MRSEGSTVGKGSKSCVPFHATKVAPRSRALLCRACWCWLGPSGMLTECSSPMVGVVLYLVKHNSKPNPSRQYFYLPLEGLLTSTHTTEWSERSISMTASSLMMGDRIGLPECHGHSGSQAATRGIPLDKPRDLPMNLPKFVPLI